MGEVRWTEVFVVTLLLLPVTEVAASTFLSSVTVRDGADVILSCENVRVHQGGCDNTTWVFTDYTSEATVALSDHGKINKDAGDKSDRLRVTEDCSLVIEKVSADDAGQYSCGQFDTEEEVVLSVVTMNEEMDGDEVTLTCSVLPDEMCPTSVRWLYQGEDVGNRSDLRTSKVGCGATVTFHKSHQLYGSSSNFLSCEVLHDESGQPLTFSLKTSPGEPGEEETTATEIRVEAVHWSLIAVCVGAAVLIIIIIIIVVVIMIVNISIAPGV